MPTKLSSVSKLKNAFFAGRLSNEYRRESEHRTVKEHHHHRNFDAFQTEIGRESITKYMKGNSFKVCKLRMQKHRILDERIRV